MLDISGKHPLLERLKKVRLRWKVQAAICVALSTRPALSNVFTTDGPVG